MNTVLTTIVESAPEWIVAVVLLISLGMIQWHAGQDRRSYRRELDGLSKRHTDEIGRLNRDHDDELNEMRSDIRELRSKVDDLERELDTERRLRRQAEDIAAQASRTGGITITPPGRGGAYAVTQSDDTNQ